MRFFRFLIAVFCVIGLSAGMVAAKPEKTQITIAVGGKAALYYLPLTLAEQLGYFRDAGLEVEILDFPGGAKALQAMMGGSADVVSGGYDHTIVMQARGQTLTAFVLQGATPAISLVVAKGKAAGWQTAMVLLSDERTFARVHIPATLRTRLLPGDRAALTIDGHEGAYEGRIRWISSDAAFTPYYALTQHDRSRLAYLAEIDVVEDVPLPNGVPVEVRFPDAGQSR